MRRVIFAAAIPVLLVTGPGLDLGSSASKTGTAPESCCPNQVAPARDTRAGVASSIRPAAATSQTTTFDTSSIYIMGAAHLPGYNDTQWRTSLEVCNFGAMTELFELAFLHRDQSNPDPETIDLSLAPGRCTKYLDVVEGVFDLDQAAGALRLDCSGEGILAMARTYNDTPAGTYGSGFRATPADEAILEGDAAVLIHLAQSLEDDSGFRTNLDLLNITEAEISVSIALYNFAGTLYDTLTATLQPFEYDQVLRVFRQVTDQEVWDGYAVVQTTTPGGAFLAGASLIDNSTGDTTAIEALRPPAAERWLEPGNVGDAINSSSNDWYPVLARDGSFMIFVSDHYSGGYGDSDIYISRRIDGVWQQRENLGANVNTSGTESAPFLTADDRTLYFTSDRQGGGTFNIFHCPLDNGVAGEVVRMEHPINTGALDCCPVVSPDGNTLYMCSTRSGGFGSMDVWTSQRVNGAWQEPTNLGAQVNSEQTDCPRWLSDDGNTLILSSTRTDGVGSADLWYVINRDGQWSRPINFGEPVNSRLPEWGPSFLGNNGTIAGRMFFGSGRSGGFGRLDIWFSDFGYPTTTSPSSVKGPEGGRGDLPYRRVAVDTRLPDRTDPGTSEPGLIPTLIERFRQADARAAAKTVTSAAAETETEDTCYCMSKGT